VRCRVGASARWSRADAAAASVTPPSRPCTVAVATAPPQRTAAGKREAHHWWCSLCVLIFRRAVFFRFAALTMLPAPLARSFRPFPCVPCAPPTAALRARRGQPDNRRCPLPAPPCGATRATGPTAPKGKAVARPRCSACPLISHCHRSQMRQQRMDGGASPSDGWPLSGREELQAGRRVGGGEGEGRGGLSCSRGRIHARTVTTRLNESRERHYRAICGAPLHVWSGVKVSPKQAPRAITGQRRIHSNSRKGKQTALSSFKPSESTADNEKYVKTVAEKGNHMRSKGSNEVVGRIDTRSPNFCSRGGMLIL